jgi:hypothetical protein
VNHRVPAGIIAVIPQDNTRFDPGVTGFFHSSSRQPAGTSDGSDTNRTNARETIMTRFARFTSIRRLAAGLLPLATVIACESPLELPPPGGPPAQVPAAVIEIQGLTGELGVGQVVTLSARVLAADGAVLNRPVTWASSDSQVASVSGTGVVTARAPGTAQVTASSGSISTHVGITVRQQGGVASVEIEAPLADLAVGQVVGLTARVRGEDGALLDRQVAWTSSDTAVATITAQGVLTARGVGQVRITASVEGRDALAVVNISAGPPAFVTGLHPASVPAGSPGFELSIRGTGYQHGATVRLDGAERPARVISSTEIRIDMSAEDVRVAGGYEVRVWNPGQALGSNHMFFVVENIPSTRTYDLLGSAWQDGGLPVLTGGFFYDGDLSRYVEQFVTAGVLRIHQPASGAVTWDLTLTMVTKTKQGEVLEQENRVFFGTVEWPAPGGQMALRSGMFPNIVLHTVSYANGDLVVYQTLHPTGDPIHEHAWRYRPR